MKKKNYFTKTSNLAKCALAMCLVVGLSVGTSSCKDYDDDIKTINDRLGKLEGSMTDLKTQIQGLANGVGKGIYVTAISEANGVITMTLSNGQTYRMLSKSEGSEASYSITVENGNLVLKKDGVVVSTVALPAGTSSITVSDSGELLVNGQKIGTNGVFIPKDGKYLMMEKQEGYYLFYYVTNGVPDKANGFKIPTSAGSQGLTELVYYPTFWVDGIEAIELPFSSYTLISSSNGFWVPQKDAAGAYVNFKAPLFSEAKYVMNSSVVTSTDIFSPEYIAHKATHQKTPKAATQATNPIIIQPITDANFNKNVMTLTIKADTTYQFAEGSYMTTGWNVNNQKQIDNVALKVYLDKEKTTSVISDYKTLAINEYDLAITNQINIDTYEGATKYVSNITPTTKYNRYKFYQDSVTAYMGNINDKNGGYVSASNTKRYEAFWVDRYSDAVADLNAGGVASRIESGAPRADARVISGTGQSVDLKEYTTVTFLPKNSKKYSEQGVNAAQSSNVAPTQRSFGHVDHDATLIAATGLTTASAARAAVTSLKIVKPSELAQYGLSLKYYIATKANLWGVQKTDQQRFADVTTDGILTPKVYNSEDWGAAEGRTPVVRIELWDNANNRMVDFKYMVVEVVKGEKEIAPIVIDLKTKYLDCTDVLVTQQQMNELVYNVLKYKAEDFHKDYPTFQQMTDNKFTTVRNAADVTMTDLVDPADANNSHQILWDVVNHLTQAQKDSLANNQTVHLEGYVRYTAGGNKSVNITVKIAVTNIPFVKPNHITAMGWTITPTNTALINVNVPGKTTTNVVYAYDPDSCFFQPILHTYFATYNRSDEDTLTNSSLHGHPWWTLARVTYPATDPNNGKALDIRCFLPEFRFSHTSNINGGSKITKVGNYTHTLQTGTVNSTGSYYWRDPKAPLHLNKLISVGSLQASAIDYVIPNNIVTPTYTNNGEIRLHNDKNVGTEVIRTTLNETKSDYIVYQGATAQVKVKTGYIEITNLQLVVSTVWGYVPVDTFNVRFIRPLNLTESKDAFEDAKDNGDAIKVLDVVNLKDWRGKVVGQRLTGSNTGSTLFPDNGHELLTALTPDSIKLGTFYDVHEFNAESFNATATSDVNIWKIDNTKVLTNNLRSTGAVDNTITAENIYDNKDKVEVLNQQVSLTVTKNTTTNAWELNYRNTGNQISQPYRIFVPVTIEYTWGKFTDYVAITVYPVNQKPAKK